jgi:hypothetical protein
MKQHKKIGMVLTTIFFILLATSLVFSETEGNDCKNYNLVANNPVDVGTQVSLVKTGATSAVFNVGGVQDLVSVGSQKSINGVNIFLKNISNSDGTINDLAYVCIETKEAEKCIDTEDGTKMVSIKGTVMYESKVYEDYCQDSTRLIDYYCESDNLKNYSVDCPLGCKEGACSREKEDSDCTIYHLYAGDSVNPGSKVTLIKTGATSAAVDVGGVQEVISLGSQKSINGVNIFLQNISNSDGPTLDEAYICMRKETQCEPIDMVPRCLGYYVSKYDENGCPLEYSCPSVSQTTQPQETTVSEEDVALEEEEQVQQTTSPQQTHSEVEETNPEEIQNIECQPNWDCSEWGPCIEKIQIRNCVDLNNCTSKNIPNLEKKCEVNCDGCSYESICLSRGMRKNTKFCEMNNELGDQKKGESSCENNYECQSNLCIDNECVSPGLWRRFTLWWSKLF